MAKKKSALKSYRMRNGWSFRGFSAHFTAKGHPVSPPTLLRWERGGIPPTQVLLVEKITGIPRWELSPKLFGAAR